MNRKAITDIEAQPSALKSKPRRNQFLACLHRALEKKEYQHAMCWREDGLAFILKDPAFIADKILMEEYCGMKFSSFVRQLNYYGFKRISSRADAKVFTHDQFTRDRRDNLKLIQRNKKQVGSENSHETSELSEKQKEEEILAVSMNKKISELEEELERLRNENQKLRYNIRVLNNQSIYETRPRHFQGPGSYSDPNPMNSTAGRYQTFFNPYIPSHFDSTNHYPNAENNLMIPNKPTFIEAYQPDCRVYQPNFAEKTPNEIEDPSQINPLTANPTDYNLEEENNFFNFPGAVKNSAGNTWNFEEISEDNFRY